ncbi:MAG: hypothetical protein KAT79_07290 [candidate division Zixibacteria bacterium]|nr:hypothetical protein [candidate division Zixibacteria bacterium]
MKTDSERNRLQMKWIILILVVLTAGDLSASRDSMDIAQAETLITSSTFDIARLRGLCRSLAQTSVGWIDAFYEGEAILNLKNQTITAIDSAYITKTEIDSSLALIRKKLRTAGDFLAIQPLLKQMLLTSVNLSDAIGEARSEMTNIDNRRVTISARILALIGILFTLFGVWLSVRAGRQLKRIRTMDTASHILEWY